MIDRAFNEPYDPADIDLAIETIKVKVQEYGAWVTVRPDIIANLPSATDEIGSLFAHQMTIGWKARFPVQRLRSWAAPTNWVQALKKRFAPAWFIKRYPVQYDTYDIDQAMDMVLPSPGDSHIILRRNGKIEPPDHYRTTGYCAFCDGPVPVFACKDGYHLNPPLAD